MPSPEIEEFAKLFVQNVRDVAIRSIDERLNPEVNTNPIARGWKKVMLTGSLDSLSEALVPDVVDCVIFCFLKAIDEGHLRLAFTASNGKTIDLLKTGSGKLANQYAGRSGWRDHFTKERLSRTMT